MADDNSEPSPPATSLLPKGLSVSTLVREVRAALREKLHGTRIMFGTVSGFKSHGFFDLVCTEDPTTSISVSFYGFPDLADGYQRAGMPLQDGLQVLMGGYFTLSKKGSVIRFIVTEGYPEYTKALQKAKRDVTNDRLKTEKLFDANKSQRFPLLPRTLGIVTSERGTVIHDLAAAIAPARFKFSYRWIKTAVTGEDAVRQIPTAIRVLGEDPRIDVVLLFRGGGSSTDLDCFNEYAIARAIAECPKPVLCAIGHKEDECSAQDVAYRNCHTPSLLGKFLADTIVGVREIVDERGASIVRSIRRKIDSCTSEVQRCCDNVLRELRSTINQRQNNFRHVTSMVPAMLKSRIAAANSALTTVCITVIAGLKASGVESRNRLRESCRHIGKGLPAVVRRNEMRMETKVAKLSSADPAILLRRGFALVEGEGGKIITSSAQIKHPQEIRILFSDSTTKATTHE